MNTSPDNSKLKLWPASSRTVRSIAASFLAVLFVLVVSLQPAAAQTPTVKTDKLDYGPTEKPQISGSNFAPSTAYDIPVIRPDGVIVKGDGSFVLGWDTVTSNTQGNFVLFHDPYTKYPKKDARGARLNTSGI